jgi:L-ascorbate metabolism protein UlaG (beta-lactamase superfamily)
MDFEYKGANCVVITTKKATIVVDPKISKVGLKDVTKFDIELATQEDFIVTKDEALIISSPGEYEVKAISVHGVSAQRHIDTPEDGKKSVVYKLVVGDMAIGIIGHVIAPLTEEQLETLGVLDVLIIPVGGNGYTLDAHSAVQVVRQVDPKVVIPTHFADKSIKYEMPQQELEGFVKELGAPHETVPKLKLKGAILPVGATVYEITRTA